MGKSQREKARAKRAAYTPYPPSSSHRSTADSSSSSPHHVDILRLAFLEWLIAHRSTSNRHLLWDSFLSDWSAIPQYELPIPVSRPFNLHAMAKGLKNGANLHAMRKEVKEGREQLREGGLKAHQTILQYYLQEEGMEGKEEGRREGEERSEGREAKQAEEDEGVVEEAEQRQEMTRGGGKGKGRQQLMSLAPSANIWEALGD